MLEKLTSIFIALLLSVFLLSVPLDSGYQVISALKYTLFMAICGGYCIMAIIARASLAIDKSMPLKIEPKKEPTAIIMLSFILLTAISAILSEHATFLGSFRREGFLTLTIYITVCFLVSKYAKPAKHMLYILSIAVCIFCALSFIQLAGFNPLTLYPEGHNFYGAGIYYSSKFIGTTGNTGFGGAFLCVASGICLMSIIKLKSKTRWLLLIPLSTSTAVIFTVGINAAIVALCAGSLIAIPMSMQGKKRIYAACASLGIIVTALAVLWFYGGPQHGMIYEASEMLHGRWQDAHGTSRVLIWRSIANSMDTRTMLIGTGPDTLGHWRALTFAEYKKGSGVFATSQVDAAHNEYLHILVSTGLPSLLCHLALLSYAMLGWFRNPDNKISAIAGTGVVFYCVQAIFGISMYISAPFFWVCLGVMLQANKIKQEPKKNRLDMRRT